MQSLGGKTKGLITSQNSVCDFCDFQSHDCLCDFVIFVCDFNVISRKMFEEKSVICLSRKTMFTCGEN